MDMLNEFWESLALDLTTRTMPFVEDITGVRIVDKSRAGQEAFRLEFWTKFNSQETESGRAISAFIEENYLKKLPAGPMQKVSFMKHEAQHK